MRNRQTKPLVSVVIPVFNGNGYLVEAVQSILNQSYKNLEVIAIDDGSSDNSYEILKMLAKKSSKMRVYRNSKNLNISHTLNRGIKLAKGQYIARMDADDVALPDRIKRQMDFLLKHPSVVIVGGQCQTINTEGKIMGKKLFPQTDRQIRRALFTTNPIQHPTAIINRALLPKKFSWYDPSLPPAEDYDLFFRLGQYGLYHNLKSFVLQYRQYLGSSTFKNPVKTFSVTRKVRGLAVKKYGYKPTLKSWLIHFAQIAAVTLLPGSFIYPLYTFVRGIQAIKLPSTSLYVPKASKLSA